MDCFLGVYEAQLVLWNVNTDSLKFISKYEEGMIDQTVSGRQLFLRLGWKYGPMIAEYFSYLPIIHTFL